MTQKHFGSIVKAKRIAAVLMGVLSLSFIIHWSTAAAERADDQQRNLSKAFKGRLPISELTEDEAILHALNRLGFGPRPGDVERVRSMGLEKWIDQQLNPQAIRDDEMDARLEHFPTLKMDTAELLKDFPTPQQVAKQEGITVEELRKQQAAARQAGPLQTRPAAATSMVAVPATPPSPPGPERLEAITGPPHVMAELTLAKLDRAIYSQRQLYEVMADFWFNHFNVFAGKGEDRWLLPAYERDSIRPHAMGKFQDLLEATAKSPAMLYYLDNWQSVDADAFERMQGEIAARRREFQRSLNGMYPLVLGPLPPQPPPPAPAKPAQARRGLNENYGRELMELHTLGVDGGYTQNDVTEVARAFTGWTMHAPRRAAEFYFAERLHDEGTKEVLGHKIHAGGMKDGEEVLDLLAHHPSTAKFISFKLARRFVSDQPPQELVDRMAKTFLSTDGDIRAVLHTMIYSPEFWARSAYQAKIKMPFELVASTARALNLDADQAMPLMRWTARIGEPLYQCQPPTGYSDTTDTWVNTGALLNRLNFALALAGNRIAPIKADAAALLGPDAATDPQKALNRAIELFLGGEISQQSRETLERKIHDPMVTRATLDDPVGHVDLGLVAGLVLGSPEFQRR